MENVESNPRRPLRGMNLDVRHLQPLKKAAVL